MVVAVGLTIILLPVVDELLQETVPLQLLAVNVALAPAQIVVVPVTLGGLGAAGGLVTVIVLKPAVEVQFPTLQVAV